MSEKASGDRKTGRKNSSALPLVCVPPRTNLCHAQILDHLYLAPCDWFHQEERGKEQR